MDPVDGETAGDGDGMKTFMAGRFKAECYDCRSGSMTTIVELAGFGSDEVRGTFRVHPDDLLDLEYVLKRAIAEQGRRRE